MRRALLAVGAVASVAATVLVGACGTDDFAANDAGVDSPVEAALVDRAPEAEAGPPPTFCDINAPDGGTDNTGFKYVACADFDKNDTIDAGVPGWTMLDNGVGSLSLLTANSPSLPRHLQTLLPQGVVPTSGEKRIERSVNVGSATNAVLDLELWATSSGNLNAGQFVTYLSISPDGNETVNGALRIVHEGLAWNAFAPGGVPSSILNVPFADTEKGWTHVRISVAMTATFDYSIEVAGKPAVAVKANVPVAPVALVFRVGVSNPSINNGDPSATAFVDNVIVRTK